MPKERQHSPVLVQLRAQRRPQTFKESVEVVRLPWRHAKHCGKTMGGADLPRDGEGVPHEEACQLRPSGLPWGKGGGGEAVCLRDPEAAMSVSTSRALRRPV